METLRLYKNINPEIAEAVNKRNMNENFCTWMYFVFEIIVIMSKMIIEKIMLLPFKLKCK